MNTTETKKAGAPTTASPDATPTATFTHGSSDVETDEDDVKTWLGAGLALKSTEGWYTAADMNFAGIKHYAALWSSTEVEDFIAYSPIAYNDRSIIKGGNNDIDLGLSVRCVLTEE